MKIELLTCTDLTEAERESLWGQGVDLDDTNFLVVCPADTALNDEGDGRLYPEDPVLDQVVGPNYNEPVRWYRVTFRGEPAVLGVQYH